MIDLDFIWIVLALAGGYVMGGTDDVKPRLKMLVVAAIVVGILVGGLAVYLYVGYAGRPKGRGGAPFLEGENPSPALFAL